jgi:hypothetical protein
MYCSICSGPTCSQFVDVDELTKQGEDNNSDTSFHKLPGVIYDDQLWLSENCVTIYADCISPPGQYGEELGTGMGC